MRCLGVCLVRKRRYCHHLSLTGFCECGYYNGLRVEAFEGPLARNESGRIPENALEWGFAEHHTKHDHHGI